MSSAISHDSITELSLIRLRSMPEPEAAIILDTRLRTLEAQYKRSFIESGVICVEVQERQLWRILSDWDGTPFHSFEAWLVACAPHSRRHCFSAMKAVKELTDIPLEKLAAIPQCNIALLETMSTGLRSHEQVLAAAESLPETEFRKHIMQSFPEQHISRRQKLVLTFDSEDYQTVCEWLDDIGEKVGLTDREGQILALAIDWKMERDEEFPDKAQAQ